MKHNAIPTTLLIESSTVLSHKFNQHLHGTLKMLKPLHCIYKVYCKA